MTRINLNRESEIVSVPKAPRVRLDVLDVLRGFAILGIFFINLPLMGLMGGSSEVTHLSAVDAAAQIFVDLFFEGTQRGMLQMLFGAGMILLTAKAMSPDGPVSVADLYLRRNMWLIFFGLLHIFVVRWGYDILHVYGLAALFLFTFRQLSAPIAFALGLSLTLIVQLMGGGIHGTELLNTTTNHLAEVDAVQMWYESVKGLGLWSTVAEAFGTMLIGLALFKWGIIQGLRSFRFYWVLMILGYSIGLVLRVSTLDNLSQPTMGSSPSELGRLCMTIGHISLINMLWHNPSGAKFLSPLKAAGRTAFTLYVMQSVIGIWLLWASWGPLTQLEFGAAGILATAVMVLALQIALANWWLRKFDEGPLEMLWRRLIRL